MFTTTSTTTTTSTSTRKRTYTQEQKARRAAWQREYRRKYPERVKKNYHAYIIRKAARLLAEQEGANDAGARL